MRQARFTSVAVVMAVALGVAPLARAADPAPPELTARMRAALTSVVALQPFLASPDAFAAPANKKKIQAYLDTLASTEHGFPAGALKEPGLAVLLGRFQSYLRQTQTEFGRGDFDRARARLQTVTSFCFACHTRVHAEKDFADVARQVDGLPLTPIARADFLASTRQFEKALDTYQSVLDALPSDETGYQDFNRALRRSMTVLVRVKGDSGATLRLLDRLAMRKDLPVFLQNDISERRDATREWAADRFRAEKASPEQLIRKARDLMQKTRGASALFLDGREEIRLLRAGQLVHEALTRKPTSQLRGEALYLLGVSASASEDPMLWDLDRLYFEVCIQEAPHSDNARRCFEAYRYRTVQGYTGSGGTRLPADELAKLGELRAVAY